MKLSDLTWAAFKLAEIWSSCLNFFVSVLKTNPSWLPKIRTSDSLIAAIRKLCLLPKGGKLRLKENHFLFPLKASYSNVLSRYILSPTPPKMKAWFSFEQLECYYLLLMNYGRLDQVPVFISSCTAKLVGAESEFRPPVNRTDPWLILHTAKSLRLS